MDVRQLSSSIFILIITAMIIKPHYSPFDVIKTKIQLEPTKYPWNPLTTSRLLQQQKIPLFTGGIPTAIG